jgi:hypothetical protein
LPWMMIRHKLGLGIVVRMNRQGRQRAQSNVSLRDCRCFRSFLE